MNNLHKLSLYISGILLIVTHASAQVVVAGWISSDQTGSIAAQETVTGISSAVMDRGPGLTVSSGFSEVYDSASWSTSPNFPGSANDDYLSFLMRSTPVTLQIFPGCASMRFRTMTDRTYLTCAAAQTTSHHPWQPSRTCRPTTMPWCLTGILVLLQ